MGIALLALSQTLGGSSVKDFLSGLLLGLSADEMLAGVYFVGKNVADAKPFSPVRGQGLSCKTGKEPVPSHICLPLRF